MGLYANTNLSKDLSQIFKSSPKGLKKTRPLMNR